MIKKHKRESNTIIALTMCDRVQTINIYDLIVKRITNETDELCDSKFYSCVAIINREHTDHVSLTENDNFEKKWFKKNIIEDIPEDYSHDLKTEIYNSVGLKNLITKLNKLYNKNINNEWITNTIEENEKNIKVLQKEYDDIGIEPQNMDTEYFWCMVKIVIEKYLYDFIIEHEKYDDCELYGNVQQNSEMFIQNMLGEIYVLSGFDEEKIINYTFFDKINKYAKEDLILKNVGKNSFTKNLNNYINYKANNEFKNDYKMYRFFNIIDVIILKIEEKASDELREIIHLIFPSIFSNYYKNKFTHFGNLKNLNTSIVKTYMFHNLFSECIINIFENMFYKDEFNKIEIKEDDAYIVKRKNILEQIDNHKKTIDMITDIKNKYADEKQNFKTDNLNTAYFGNTNKPEKKIKKSKK